jgi:hypothetical protein
MPLTLMPMLLQIGAGQQSAARAPTRRRCDRNAAMLHAKSYWNRHCCDGHVAVKRRGTPPYREVVPGEEFEFYIHPGDAPNRTADQVREKTKATDGSLIEWEELGDCTHFVSCCIGRPYDAVRIRPLLEREPTLSPARAPRMYAGGLNIRSTEGLGAPWVYGIVGAPRLVAFLRQPHVGRVTADRLEKSDSRLEAAVNALQPGDVIALHGARNYFHVLLYDGEGGVYGHTACRTGIEWFTWDSRYTCIHIHDDIEDGR